MMELPGSQILEGWEMIPEKGSHGVTGSTSAAVWLGSQARLSTMAESVAALAAALLLLAVSQQGCEDIYRCSAGIHQKQQNMRSEASNILWMDILSCRIIGIPPQIL